MLKPAVVDDPVRLETLIKTYKLEKTNKTPGRNAIKINSLDELERILNAKRRNLTDARSRNDVKGTQVKIDGNPRGNGPRRVQSSYVCINFGGSGQNVGFVIEFTITTDNHVSDIHVHANPYGFGGAEITSTISSVHYANHQITFNYNMQQHSEFNLFATFHHYDYVNANFTADYNTGVASYHVVSSGDGRPTPQ